MPSRSLSDCDPELVARYDLLAEDFAREHPNQKLVVTCTWRSKEEQLEAYKTGHSKLLYGNHNHLTPDGKPFAQAIDVAVFVDGKLTWDPQYYRPLIELADRHGLVSGGSWHSFKDWPHLELPS